MTFVMGPALLFCPADRPERYQKAATRADAVILDLEDAVAPADKQRARGAILAQVGATGDEPELDPSRTIVRVNPAGTEEFEKDLHCLAHTPYRTVMLAKAESAGQLEALGDYQVIALCETAAGVLNAPAIAAAPNVVALMWGAEDLLATLGGTSSRKDDGGYRAVALHARSSVLLAARAFGKEAVDAVYVNIPDLAGLAAEAADAVASGFSSKACIHPSQAAVVRGAYAPSEAEVTEAAALLQAARAAGSGVFQYNGKMIDGPILKHAEAVIRRAGRHPAQPGA
ncbi:HpcH/HpaI aldolase/citrate lyase family protein [Arthrobacter nitrophenolicus]|uniref:Citrate lyase subunit beta/citryl-CoA lyase n=2 Tax=Arthrobacter nitrophenolicus TaxID=683150 RepID=A0ACC6TBS4_9MICC|nr:CoA ester lyase [Arthrobacter nitrophenolicus]ELT44483.1 HpcH/HpaI aldolase [Arthrobacter nitrophenolicus]